MTLSLAMDMQHTHTITKQFILVLGILLCLGLTGCVAEIPEGDIKDFVEAIDFDETFKNITHASSTVTSSHYLDGQLQGAITTFTYIDLQNGKYHYSKTTLSGSYYGTGEDQFNYYSKETISYIDEFGNAVAYELTDGVVEEKKYRPEDIDILINSFFYTDNELNYHKGGVYYGDYVYVNCAKNYQFFSLNEDKSVLKYSLNTFYTNKDDVRFIIMHSFTIDKLGMILNLETKTIEELNHDTYSKTTIDCDYETAMEKIYDFN